jgi:hypothetical protein
MSKEAPSANRSVTASLLLRVRHALVVEALDVFVEGRMEGGLEGRDSIIMERQIPKTPVAENGLKSAQRFPDREQIEHRLPHERVDRRAVVFGLDVH